MRGVTSVMRSAYQLRAAAVCSQEGTSAIETSLKTLTRAAQWPGAACPSRHVSTRDGMQASAPVVWARTHEQYDTGALQID